MTSLDDVVKGRREAMIAVTDAPRSAEPVKGGLGGWEIRRWPKPSVRVADSGSLTAFSS